MDGCYVTNHGLRKHQAQGTYIGDNGKQHTPATNVQPKVAPTAQYIIVSHNRPEKPNSSNPTQQHVSQKEVQPLRPIRIDDAPTDVRISVFDARTNEIDLDEQYQPNIIGTNTPTGHNTVQGPIDDTNNIQVDSHGYDIPKANIVKKSGRHDLSRSDKDFSSGECDEDEGWFFSDLDDAHNFSHSDIVIDRMMANRLLDLLEIFLLLLVERIVTLKGICRLLEFPYPND